MKRPINFKQGKVDSLRERLKNYLICESICNSTSDYSDDDFPCETINIDNMFEKLSDLKKNKRRDEYVFVELINDKYYCRLCGANFKYKLRDNMKTMFNHFIKYHNDKELFDCLKSLFVSRCCVNKEIQKDVLDDLIIQLIVNNNLSFSIVDSPEMRKLMNYATNGSYEPPSRKTITTKIVESNNKIYKGINSFLSYQNIQRFSLSFDIWQPSKRSFGYLGVSLFFLDNNFALKCFPIGCRKLYQTHTSENIWKLLSVILERVGIKFEKEKFYLVTDGGSNVKSACNSKNWFYCCAHQIERALAMAQQEDQFLSS